MTPYLETKAQQARAQSDHIQAQPAALLAMGHGIKAGTPPWGAGGILPPQQFPAAPMLPPAVAAPAAVNPKELAGAKKPATWSVLPRWIVLAVGRVMSVGAAKYGAFNYRESPIAASTYQDALERHLGLWFDGEDSDSETGVSHLASAIASCALLMDAQATGKLVDDRQKTGLARKTLDELEALLVTLPLPSRRA